MQEEDEIGLPLRHTPLMHTSVHELTLGDLNCWNES
jgi:hypothetical protein